MAELNQTSNSKLSDAELEQRLKPYADKVIMCTRTTLLSVALGAIACIAMKFHLFASAACIVLIILAILGLVVSQVISAKNRTIYEKLFHESMDDELEKTISSYFGPQLEKAASTTGAEVTAFKKDLEQRLKQTGLCKDWDHCALDSYRRGKWKNLLFDAFNAKMTAFEEGIDVDTDGNVATETEMKTVFRGTWMICELAKNIAAPITIREMKDPSNKLDPYWNVSSENAAFAERFLVHAEDTALAEAILTPQLAQQISDLRDMVGGELGLFFTGTKLYLAMQGDREFYSMSGGKTDHISDLRENLKKSLDYYGSLMDLLLKNTELFG